jgi:hypothetical protein
LLDLPREPGWPLFTNHKQVLDIHRSRSGGYRGSICRSQQIISACRYIGVVAFWSTLSCLFLVTASRMRACARDTASRLCVRTVLCSSAFSLAPPLRSTGSAAAEPPCSLASSLLRAGPTSPSRSSSASASGLPDNVPATTGGDGDGDLPVPVQKASAHARVYDDAGSACVSRYRHRPCCLLWDGKHQHPELVLRRSIPRLRPPL